MVVSPALDNESTTMPSAFVAAVLHGGRAR
jgi:hypothetical protein